MNQLENFHEVIILILVLVISYVGLYIIIFLVIKSIGRREEKNNHVLEMIWTVIPMIIICLISFFSLRCLYILDNPFLPGLRVKCTGNQWYWSYNYCNFNDLRFDSLICRYNTNINITRLLSTDNSLVLPEIVNINIYITRNDVIHSWSIPTLGIKVDAVPGRVNFISFTLDRLGVFYGQCSEICGANHRFIPIKLESASLLSFLKWLK